ncbi:MAG: hypothetical protein GX792_01740, partial [Bacteroidales bacterium]|nr:hypothetical protein [Bacteroidales bacterium]
MYIGQHVNFQAPFFLPSPLGLRPTPFITSENSVMAVELVLTIENVLKHGKDALTAAKDIVAESAIDFGLAYLLIHLMDKLRISQTLEKVLPTQ